MNPSFQAVTPDRLQIREGGGCLSAFGVPFFAAGIFMFLTVVGVVPMSNGSEQTALTWMLVGILSAVFTAVGGWLVFGRSWTIIDRSQREVIRQRGLLVPMHERVESLDGCNAVRLGFVEGDSDSSDTFPIAMTSASGRDLKLASFTSYALARECARTVADYVNVDVEDASTEHPVRLRASEIDLPVQERLRRGGLSVDLADRPAGARSTVTQGSTRVTIEIPSRPMHWLAAMAGLLPLGIPLAFGPPLATFFRESKTPDPVGWAFLAFLTVCFGVLPTMIVVGAFLRSRRGATIVEVSRQGLHVRERGVWKTNTMASLDAADVLDVDYGVRDSTRASSRLARFVTGRGLTVKSRTGLTTIGKGLDDEEVRYLRGVILKALVS
jgi:hypothetical protein